MAKDTHISRIRAHIGISGNEEADQEASLCSILGRGEDDKVVTGRGLIAWGKRRRAKIRKEEGYGKDIVQEMQGTTAAPYTWCRTNKGPIHSWLHRISKADYCVLTLFK